MSRHRASTGRGELHRLGVGHCSLAEALGQARLLPGKHRGRVAAAVGGCLAPGVGVSLEEN